MNDLIMFIAQAAPTAPTTTRPGAGPFFMFALMIGLVAFMLLTSRSQKKREKRERENMHARMAKNDRVLTIGGVVGTVISVKDNEVVVKVTLPGVKPDEVDITITGDALIIKGEHKEEREVKDESYIRRERRSGSFTRTVLIPVSVQSDKAEATFENGVLTLTLPKAEEVKPRQIKVKPKMRIEGEKGK